MSPKVRPVRINSLRRRSDKSNGTAVNQILGSAPGVNRLSKLLVKQEPIETNAAEVTERRSSQRNKAAFDDSEDSDAGSTYTNKFSERGTCLPFGLLPPVTKEVITYMEALLQYMKEVYRSEGEHSSISPPEPAQVPISSDVKLGGAGKVEIYPDSHCYISKSKMTTILLRADEDPENWTKLTRAILEEVYGKDLANLSAKGTRGSQGIYVPLYNALFALVNDRLRPLNKSVLDHEFTKRINKICSNMRGAAKRTGGASGNPVAVNPSKPLKIARTVPTQLTPLSNVQCTISSPDLVDEEEPLEERRNMSQRRAPEVSFDEEDPLDVRRNVSQRRAPEVSFDEEEPLEVRRNVSQRRAPEVSFDEEEPLEVRRNVSQRRAPEVSFDCADEDHLESRRNLSQRRAPEVSFDCGDDDSFQDCSVMMPVDVELDDTGEVEIFPQSQCYISKSKMNSILLRADEDPDNWIKLTRYILEEMYGEDLANLSAKGTRGSQGIYTPLYNAIYALVNDRLRRQNKTVSEHEFNKRINKICSNKRGAVKRAARRTDLIPAGLIVNRPYRTETDEEDVADESSYDHKQHLSVTEILKNKSELIITPR